VSAPTPQPRTARALKTGLHRRVFLEEDADGVSRVVKRFEGRSLWKRLVGGLRARREFALQTALAGAGAPVARPLAVGRREGAWEFSVEYIEGALTLADLLAGGTPPCAREELAQALGRALAALQEAGCDHGDLHAGNIVFDSSGAAFVVDFGHATRCKELDAARLTHDLVQLAAATRERVPPSLRWRALLAWRCALTEPVGRDLPPLRELARKVEAAAVVWRAQVLFKNRRRWLRASGLCWRLDHETLAHRGLPADHAKQIASELAQDSVQRGPQPHPEDDQLEIRLFEGAAPLRQGWVELGRALEHGLPALTPLVLREGANVRAAFALPRGTQALVAAEAARDLERMALARLLAGRGLEDIPTSTPLWRAPGGELLLGPEARLVIRSQHQGPQERRGG